MPVGGIAVEQIAIHGFVSQGYRHSTGNHYLGSTRDGSFEFNEVALNARADFGDLHAGIQLFSRDLGRFGNNRITVDWAFGDYSYRDDLGLRIGRFKTATGLYNESQDLDLARTQVFLPHAVYDPAFREAINGINGLQLYGNLGLGRGGDLDYQLHGGTTTIRNDGSVALLLVDGEPLESHEVEIDATFGASFTWNTPLTGLRTRIAWQRVHDLHNRGVLTTAGIGAINANIVAGYQEAVTAGVLTQAEAEALIAAERIPTGAAIGYDIGFEDVDLFFVGIEYTRPAWHCAIEYHRIRTDRILTIPQLGQVQYDEEDREGWYAMVGHETSHWCTVALTYSEYYLDADDRKGDRFDSEDYRAWQRDLALSARFDIDEWWILKAEGHLVHGVAQAYRDENPGGFEEEWAHLALKSTFIF